MNDDPALASLWKGRILCHLAVVDTKAPEKGVVDMDPEIQQMVDKEDALKVREFVLQAEVGAAICLPAAKKYTVRI